MPSALDVPRVMVQRVDTRPSRGRGYERTGGRKAMESSSQTSRRAGLSGALLSGVPGSRAQPRHHGVQVDRRDPDLDRRRQHRQPRPPASMAWRFASATGGVLFLAPLLMIVFRQKYPRWWFDWNLELLRFANRIGVYLALMDDRYPSTDERTGCRARLSLPGREAGPQPLAAAREVAARDPPLHPARLPLDRGRDLGGDRLVCDPLHRPLSRAACSTSSSASSAGLTGSLATHSSSSPTSTRRSDSTRDAPSGTPQTRAAREGEVVAPCIYLVSRSVTFVTRSRSRPGPLAQRWRTSRVRSSLLGLGFGEPERLGVPARRCRRHAIGPSRNHVIHHFAPGRGGTK